MQQQAISGTFPPPVGGWNAADEISQIPPRDAIFLDNFWPTAAAVTTRKGSELFATLPADTEPGSPHNVRALCTHNAPGGTKTLFAGCDDGLYNITAGGSINSVSSAATNGAWESVNISTAGGHFLWCCNGVDKARVYDGSTWTVLDGSSSPSLTGITSTDITNVSLFKTRLILTKKNSLSFFYLGVNSIAGSASEFPLGAIFPRGGYLLGTATWTRDGGSGPDDYFVALTSEGEVAVYAGTDPSSASAFGLQGVYYIGKPSGKRAFLKLFGDLAVLTAQGFYPLSKALMEAGVKQDAALSAKIVDAWTSYQTAGSGLFGWQAVSFPEQSMVLVNVPVVINHTQGLVHSYQFVRNMQTGAWARFTGMPAECWHYHDGGLYFGKHNKVYKAWVGYEDDGQPIDCRLQAGYSYPATRGRSSRITLMRPVIQSSSASFTIQLAIDTDYRKLTTLAGNTAYTNAVAVWDQSLWDQAFWGGSVTVANWRTPACRVGRAHSYRFRVNARGLSLTLSAMDYIGQVAGMR